MATSLAAQLAQVAANSKSTLNVKAQKAAHSKSLIWEPRVAATQSYQVLYTTCYQGFEELCQLDSRFTQFQSTIFSEESQNEDRTQLTAAENQELDRRVQAFLRLAGSRLRLMPAIKAIEWLIRRFRIHEENTGALLLAFLPYHSIPAFATLLSILPTKIPHEFRFLDPYVRSVTSPPRSVLVHQAVHHPAFLTLISEYTLESCRMQYNYPALISFWAGIMTEAVSGILDRTRSGRSAVQSENDQALLHRLGPIFAESLVMKKVPSIQIASYMAIAVFVSKGNLEDVAVTAFMDQTVYGWTNDTVRPGLVCLAILAQYRSAKQMSGKTTKALIKVSDIGQLLVEIGQERRVDKLANGLCLALIERLTKKGDPRGLATIMAILSSTILKDKQISVIFKSLILTAHRLNDDNDEDGALRRELGSALITLSQNTGKSGDIIQSVIEDVKFDIEELEMKLDLSFRSRRLPDAAKDGDDVADADQSKAPQDIGVLLEELSGRSEGLSPCLVPQPGEIFDEFSHIFFSIVSEKSQDSGLLAKFEQSSKLQRQAAFKDCTYFSFFIRIWCGPYPAMARVAALDMAKRRLKTGDAGKTDLQSLLPYCIAALSDPSKRVRQSAADLITVVTTLYTPPVSSSGMTTWGEDVLYGKPSDSATLTPDVVARMLHLQILPTVEECVIDPEHISAVLRTSIEQGKYQSKPDSSLDKKDHMSQPGRLSLLTFLASHIVNTPLVLVKNRLLKCVNEIRGVSTTTRTQLLLPALQWWANLSDLEAAQLCSSERLEKSDMDTRFVDVVVPNDTAGLEFFLKFLRDPEQREKSDLIRAIFARIRKMWAPMKAEVKFIAAEQLLDISQESASSGDSTSIVPAEAADLLRNVKLTTDILSFFLDSIQTGTKMITEPPPNKRRRTSSSGGDRGLITQVTPELSQALRKVTYVLQLVENSEPVEHPELLDGLFTALSELQHFRTVVGSELGYLQNLILRSVLAMMPAYKTNKKLKIDSSGGYGDLLVNCIQKSSSPVVQNAALLLIASLATTAPNLVLHSVMPIFTFMGTSVLRQSDDYSAHVVSQTIKEVIPPLIDSLRQGQKSPVAGASDILVSFTTAYEHIPAHRRQGLFVALVETLGPEEFLHGLISMLVDRYGPSDALLQFVVELLNNFSIEAQLDTLVKLWDLIADLFKSKPGISFVLLGISDDRNNKDIQEIALRQLSAFPTFLSSKKLKSKIGGVMEQDDMQASRTRELYATLLENILVLADNVKATKSLHSKCGHSLQNHLNLLSIGEFIKAVENLLDRSDMGLRQKVLRALEVRVEQESNTDPASRSVLLAFLPQLTAGIRESSDIRYKHTAVTCVDKIAEKYGKKDIEAVVGAAATIAGEHCLGQSEQRLRVMALLCLTSLVDVLQDAIIPVLPSAIPQAVAYLNQSIEGEELDEELHVASYGFISSLAEHLPYMLSTYVDRILEVSNKSAEIDLDEETKESRVDCLHFLAKQLDAKDIFSSLDRNWESATASGYSAVSEYLNVLGLAIDKHPKSGISKNVTLLSSILKKAFDFRRQEHAKGELSAEALQKMEAIDENLNDKALKMIYKLNDAAFRPVFVELVDWSGTGTGLTKSDRIGRSLRQYSVYGFLKAFFGGLKSIVTNYATYVVDDAVKILKSVDLEVAEEQALWSRVLQTLAQSFEHDQDDFWQAPAHFGAVGPAMMEQFSHAGLVDVTEDLIPATVELASAADSQAHQKELNSALLKHLRSEQTAVRLGAVRCEQALTDRLGEEWLSMLHEMLPRISELQEDDDEVVERETHRWIVKIEGLPMASIARPEARVLVQLSRHSQAPGLRSRSTRLSSTVAKAALDGSTKERIVVLGSGWAGYALARTLSPSSASRILISPRSHFVFTPLLASTAVGTLEFRAAIEPVRRLGLTEFHQAWASDIDFKRKVIRVETNTRDELPPRPGAVLTENKEFEVPYDKLVVAVGCYSQTFGVEGVREHASFLRDVKDSRSVRLKVLQAFEKAALPTASAEDRKKLLHFAVVGGGPTGIEFAAELHDLVHEDLSKLYPELMQHVAITIYDIAPKVLPMFDQNLATYATEMFRRNGIRVKTEHHLQRIRRDGEVLMMSIKEEPEEVGAGIVVWSTGLMQNPLVGTLLNREIEGVGKIAKDPKSGGIMTDAHLRVQVRSGDGSDTTTTTLPDVFAIGDCAVVQGQSLPATAQVASQQAVYLGKRLNAKTESETKTTPPFSFRNWGTMAYLGGWRAIHQSKGDELKGRAAWILWRTAYLTKSMSVRNKVMIPIYWLVTWIFGRDISRF
ncbi:hypothetical protein G7Z17_g7482 [Cylindrodendrum hubeiense]|uniref:U3 small nucleolar RNA-associated protein 10 n=1 Tax=Cylindrodendrum hubeiense TaxID=595255 RepID=A0A9P5H3M3_9HYPO|nr:hypothetical protein G7Z17_g7482 [Cylindrodendrum hubeiense]